MSSSASRRRGPYAGSEEKKAAIVKAAFQVFAEHGYQGGSLQKIADLIGMSQTSLLHYFPRKADLLLAVLAMRDDMGDVDLETIDPVNDFVDSVMVQARNNQKVPGVIALHVVLSAEAVTQDNPGQEFFLKRQASLLKDYTGVFQAFADAGRLRPGITPESVARQLLALWNGLEQLWLLTPDEVDVAADLAMFFQANLLPAE